MVMERPSDPLKLVRSDFFVARQEASLRLITKAQVIEGICHYVLDRWHQLTPENQVALGLDTATAESADEQALQSVTWLLLEAAGVAAQKARHEHNERLDTADY
jgi:hypothetical protein